MNTHTYRVQIFVSSLVKIKDLDEVNSVLVVLNRVVLFPCSNNNIRV